MPIQETSKKMVRWSLAASSFTLAACSSMNPQSQAPIEQRMEISFVAAAGDKIVRCDQPINGLGTTWATAALRDLRFYVSDVALINDQGKSIPMKLEINSWQTNELALIDLADASGACASSSPEINNRIVGTLPPGDYQGIRFTVGVPHALNHSDYASAKPPLDVQAMSWAWQAGRKFMQVEINPEGGVARAASQAAPGRSFLFHLGATGCKGNPVSGETVQCERPNRLQMSLDRFDPKRQQITLDLVRLYAGVNILRDQGGALGCMSAASDPECRPIFKALGVDLVTGATAPQTESNSNTAVFRATPK